jgi:GH24 family phage-related lysozyme (muramidase)
MKWVKAGTPLRTQQGLVNRRRAEVELFTRGVYA